MFTFDPTVALFVVLMAVCSALLTALAILVARRLRLLAHPVERSSHRVPTPQVGGVGICLAILAGLFILAQNIGMEFLTPADPSGRLLRSLFGITALGLLLGLIDDIRPLGAKTKLVGLIVLASIPVYYHISLNHLLLPGMPHVILGRWVGGALTLCWVIFFANAFNFMDGVNGQSGVFTVNAIFWMALTAPSGETGPLPLIMAIVIGAVIGFLPWNFPRAKTFMGDSGSLPLGGILATIALFHAQGSVSSFIGVCLALSPYIYDVIYTLIRRMRRHEDILTAHRSHLYQRLLIATGWSHARLLAFHLPLYLLTGAAALIYHVVLGRTARAVVIVAVLALLVMYTRFVQSAEAAKAARESGAN